MEMTTRNLVHALLFSTALTSSFAYAKAALANPLDPVVKAGSATVSQPDARTTIINQSSNRAVIDWRRFDIAPGETTRFNQPSQDAWTLNRVTGSQSPSQIHGTLSANGNVVIVNPDGIHFGPGSRVDVNRLIATTADITNDNFMSGNMVFDLPGNPSASIVNEGNITIADHGLGAFVAPAVRNSGVISARLGQVSLAAGNTFTIDPYGDGLVSLTVGDEIAHEVFDVATGKPVSDLVLNEGTISADGGVVALSAATARRAVNSVINNTGVIEANTIESRGGKIILGAQTSATKTANAPRQRVRISGRLSATNFAPINRVVLPKPRPESRGVIAVTGEDVEVTSALIDASGNDGGGAVLIGGDYLGGRADAETLAQYGIIYQDFSIPTASTVTLSDSAEVRADGGTHGDGGKVVVWSNVATNTSATISARGGKLAGHGGFIETSGGFLNVTKTADASAPSGKAGTWLLDPRDMFIRNAAANDVVANPALIGGTIPGTQFTPTDTPSVVDTVVLEAALNAGTNIQVTNRGIAAGGDVGDITIEDNISKTGGGNADFFVNSFRNIIIDDGVSVTSTSGALNFNLVTTDGAITGQNIGLISLNGGQFLMEARDDIRFDTPNDVPNNVSISKLGVSPNPVSTVDVRFDQERVRFTHDNTTATFASDDTFLTDTSASGDVTVALRGLDVLLNDRALAVNGGRTLGFNFGTNNTFLARDHTNDIPEVTGPGTLRVVYGGAMPPQPTIETTRVNAATCIGVTCVETPRVVVGAVVPAATPVVAETPVVADTPVRTAETNNAPQTNDLPEEALGQELLGPEPLDRNFFSERLADLGEIVFTIFNSANGDGSENSASENREEVLAYIKRSKVILDGVGEFDETQLNTKSAKYGSSWLDVFGELIAVEEIVRHVRKNDYQKAIEAVAKHQSTKVLGKTKLGSTILSSFYISGLAVLPIDISLEMFVDGLDKTNLKEQKVAYYYARDEGISHSDIISGKSDKIFFRPTTGFIYTAPGLQKRAGWGALRAPTTRYDSKTVFESVRIMYDIETSSTNMDFVKNELIEEFLSN